MRTDTRRSGRIGVVAALLVCVLLLCTPALFAGGKQETGAEGAVPEAAEGMAKEAPMLAALVAQGELPPLEERLPEEPLVIQVVEEIGEYGGQWNRAALSVGDTTINSRMGYESWVRWKPDASGVDPNVFRDWEVSDGGRVFTFFLREGMKWSDGVDFTADDILFCYEDMWLNEELSPTFPAWLKAGGEPVEVRKIDDYTVEFRFAAPYGLFLQNIAFRGYSDFYRAPKHYLEQFHVNYATESELAQRVEDAGFEYWYELFADRNAPADNPDRPVLRPWKMVTPPPATRMVAERNPYYWKVDPEGNQLPYIDSVAWDIVESPEIINFKAAAGELDMQLRHIMWDNFTLLMESREEEDFRVLMWPEGYGVNAGVQLNQSHEDPVKRELFQNRDFRIALSHAIDRNELNELNYLGLGEARHATQIELSPYYVEGLAEMYSDYDPDKANDLLDDVGLSERDGEGFRLGPDGKSLTINITLTPRFGPWPDVAQLVKEYWEEVGIRTTVKTMQRTLRTQLVQGNGHDVDIWTVPGILLLNAWPYVAWNSTTGWAPLYGMWYNSGGTQGEEPPEYIRKNMELYDEYLVTVDQEEQDRLAKEIVTNMAEECYIIGTVGNLPALTVVKNNFRNVPEEAISAWTLLTPGYTQIEQYFIRQD